VLLLPTELVNSGYSDLAAAVCTALTAKLKSKKEYQQALRRAKQAYKKASDTQARRAAFDELAAAFKDLGTALDGVSINRKSEKTKFNNLKKNLKQIARYTQPDYIGKFARDGNFEVTDYTVDMLFDGFIEHIESTLRVFDRITSYLSVEAKFKHGPFTVFNSFGYSPDEYGLVFEQLDRAAALIKKAGFGKILYGNVYLAGERQGRKHFGGRYSHKTDGITLNCDAAHSFDSLYSLVHEFGHRYWYKFLNQAQQDKYEDMFSGTAPALSIKDREQLWEAWRKGGYKLRGAKQYLTPEIYETLKMYLHDLRGVSLVPDERLGYKEEAVYRNFVGPKQRFYHFDKQPPASVTRYGSTDIKEDFAEVFAHHVTGRKLTPDAEKRFRTVL
jgi:hypothetical protein